MRTIILFVSILLVIYSCTSETKNDFTVHTKEIYVLDSTKSAILWDRFVDNKVINKKVKLFGAYMDVKMENVTFNTSGTTPVVKGELQYNDSNFTSGSIEMDFSVCRFYSEEEESFFVVKDFPNSVLTLKSLKQDSAKKNTYNIIADLSLRDSVKEITFPAEYFIDSLKNINIKGKYIMQTLDWPIRENPDKANIRKDEITFNFDLFFRKDKTVTDTIFNNKK